MNNTHGEILHNTADALYRIKPEELTGGSSYQSRNNYHPPRGEVGWICPVCGRGNAPSTAYCNCNMTKPDIAYANGGWTDRSILDDAIPCNNEYATAAIKSNSSYIATTTANASK